MTVTPVSYTPPPGHGLDVELIQAEELRRRVELIPDRGVERVDFHCLLHVSEGHYEHMVDFETIRCTAGSCVMIQPGQVNRFGDQVRWNGWMVVFRSELMQPESTTAPIAELEFFRHVELLPTHVVTTGSNREAVAEGLERMAADSTRGDDPYLLNALLRAQFRVLLMRLHLARKAATSAEDRTEPAILQRFRTYRTTVEREFRRWHKVSQYADQMGCSSRTLSRATLQVTDKSAKSFLVDRIVLEAKRLLAHTVLSVSTIGDQLGFDEATNFVKFFRRETGSTPGEFRKRHTTH